MAVFLILCFYCILFYVCQCFGNRRYADNDQCNDCFRYQIGGLIS